MSDLFIKFNIIDDNTPGDILFDSRFSRGAVQRDYTVDPQEMFAPPSEIKTIPRSEWDARIEEQEREESSLEHILRREPQFRPLDQDGIGYCWNHSVTHAVMADQLKMNQPYVRLSAFAIGCMLMDYKDRGGWCGYAAKFAREKGIPSVEYWPEQAMSRQYNNAQTWSNAEQYRITSDWCDLTAFHYSAQNLTFDQLATCLLLNKACPVDFNWWAHSVCAVRLVKVEDGSYGIRILNSWYEQPKVKPWGDFGFATLRGKRAIPDSALAILGTSPGKKVVTNNPLLAV